MYISIKLPKFYAGYLNHGAATASGKADFQTNTYLWSVFLVASEPVTLDLKSFKGQC